MKLNLEAKNETEVRIKTYLENNVSETLAEKINNGVRLEKDRHQLLSKKTLTGFIKFTTDEARKLAEKGANCACVEDDVVFGWAIHYFEEDSIEGVLYNLDGTEYKPVVSKPKTTATPPKVEKKSQQAQYSLFDMMLENKEPEKEEADQGNNEEKFPSEEEIQEALKEIAEEEQKAKPTVSPAYTKYMDLQKSYPGYIVAYRLGDFYEIFGENAKIVADELDLTLTGRDCGLESRVPMVGFPYHVADNYFNKMAKRHKVVCCDFNGEVTFYPPEDDFGLTEEEMRKFDGDINDDVIVDEDGVLHDKEDILEKEQALARAFNTDALISLDKLLGKTYKLG